MLQLVINRKMNLKKSLLRKKNFKWSKSLEIFFNNRIIFFDHSLSYFEFFTMFTY